MQDMLWNMMKKNIIKTIILLFIAVYMIAPLAYALSDFDLSCESPVTAVRELDGEIKYRCEVTNKGSSNLELRYEVDARNPIDQDPAAGRASLREQALLAGPDGQGRGQTRGHQDL